MEKSSKRGKIPQHDWPSIISRYEAGETLASIARTYDCSPPAISYIVSRTRARGTPSEGTASKIEATASEQQTFKAAVLTAPNDMAGNILTHSSDPPAGDNAPARQMDQPMPEQQPVNIPNLQDRGWFADPPNVPPPATGQGLPENSHLMKGNSEKSHDSDPAADSPPIGTSIAAPTPGAHVSTRQIGEPRRTLHLSLAQKNGTTPPAPHNATNIGHTTDVRPLPRPQGQSEFASSEPGQAPPFRSAPNAPSGTPGPGATPYHAHKTMEGGAFIDHALRERINDDIAAFLAAFDAALDHDTAESRTELRVATDRLLRAGARTRIELERLEARIPLPPRDGGLRPLSASRPTR
jgi:hypothetical protein